MNIHIDSHKLNKQKKTTYELMIIVPDESHTNINFSFFSSPILFLSMRKTKYDETYDAFLIYDNFLLNIYFNEINSTHIYRLKHKSRQQQIKLREKHGCKMATVECEIQFKENKHLYISNCGRNYIYMECSNAQNTLKY